jgi:sec-independent protein translocase protein TatC
MSTPETEGSRLTLAGHLEELRRRLAVSLAALLVGVGVGLTQVERIIRWLQRPAEEWLPRFAFFSPAEPLLAYLKVGVLAGLVLAMPVLLGQLWGFVRAGLTPRERSWGGAFVWWGSVQFLAGAAFAYLVLLPISLRVLLGIGRDLLVPVVSINQYLAFATSLVLWCGLVFELPVVLFILAKVGIVTPEWLRQQRPLAILAIAIIGALVTPTTDPVTMLLVSVPLALFYELAIVLTRVSMRRRPPD